MIGRNNISVFKINQFNNIDTSNDKGVYSGVWKLSRIINSLRFTYRVPKDQFDDDYTPPKIARNDSDYFQRLFADDRTSKIIDFLINQFTIKNSLITFPSNFIVSLQKTEITTKEEFEKVLNTSEKADFNTENLGVFYSHDKNEITLPELDLMLVVDGQHRLAGLKALYYAVKELLNELDDSEDIKSISTVIGSAKRKIIKIELTNEELLNFKASLENFELCCTVLFDFDIWEQGKVFADVNFNQKPVNRSLYYDIYGSFPNENGNEIFLLHKWCLKLNSDDDSELKGKIKMLGNGAGFVSQAFFCDAMLPFMRNGGIWYKIASDFNLDRQDESNKIEKFLKAFFNAISKRFGKQNNVIYFWPDLNDTPKNLDSILLKTTGLGALIGIIPNFYNLVKNDIDKELEVLTDKIYMIFLDKLSEEKLKEIHKNNQEKLKLISSKITGEYYFSKTKGSFSGGAGKGMQGKLYKELMTDFNFTKVKHELPYSLF